MSVPDIEIPSDLRPSDGRFGSGPSKVRSAAVSALAEAAAKFLGTSHRQAGVRSVVGRLRSGLADLYGLPDGYEIALGVGGATLFWDAAAFGLIERRSEHLVFGEFSSKFAAVTKNAPHLEDPLVVESDPGTHPDVVPDRDVDAYALTHNETSTGVMMEVARPAGGGLVLVDGTSAAGALRVDAAEFDAYYFSPQKAFGSEGGLWLALLSPAAIGRIEQISASGRWMPPTLDLRLALENSRQDQTYNTPALATLYLMAHQVDWFIDRGGLEWAAARCDASADLVYGWADAAAYACPFVAKPDERSHTVATIDLDSSVPADTVAKVLRANGIVDTESYRKLGRNQLRVALFPAIDPDDVVALTHCIDHVVATLGR
jgi:phosphoserine aminotransferase